MSSFFGRDLGRAMTYLAENVVLNVPGRSSLSGRYEGRDRVVYFLSALAERTGGTLRFEIEDVLANDRRVVVLFSPSARRGDREWVSRAATAYRVEDALIREITVFHFDLYAFDDFVE
jgi:ketosteroid isomerase-like protein